MRRLLATVLCVVACGSATHLTATPEEDRALASVRLVSRSQVDPKHVKVLLKVEGTSCKVGLHDPEPSEEDAMTQLKLWTVRNGGNAVVDTACEAGGVDFGKNCFASITCTGLALQLGAP